MLYNDFLFQSNKINDFNIKIAEFVYFLFKYVGEKGKAAMRLITPKCLKWLHTR